MVLASIPNIVTSLHDFLCVSTYASLASNEEIVRAHTRLSVPLHIATRQAVSGGRTANALSTILQLMKT
tara:strand:- start:11330 stop:11536 length:207 start_codon:yes stop_codon:yes gene_type:complete